MAGDIQVKVSGIEDVKKALRDLPVKLRKRALLNALRAGGRVFSATTSALSVRTSSLRPTGTRLASSSCASLP